MPSAARAVRGRTDRSERAARPIPPVTDPAVVARLQFMAPVPEDRRQEYLELWQEVKTSFGQ